MEHQEKVEVPDGPTLEARLGSVDNARGGLVVCHPHPLYGGDMDNPVVVRAVEVGSEAGVATLRFNFRGVGASTGIHGQGRGEKDDVKATVALLASRLPEGRPLGLAGYSFGAWMAAQVAAELGSRLAGLCLIAPPLAMADFGSFAGGHGQVLIVSGTRDSYCPLESLTALAHRLPSVRVTTVEGADHFFFGKLFPLGEALGSWIGRWLDA